MAVTAREWLDREPDPDLGLEYDGKSAYEAETRLPLALSALIPEDQLVNPDHRMFQIVHLITEYAWSQMHFELRRVVDEMVAREYAAAARLLGRVAEIADLPVVATRVLLNALPQFSLMDMRATFPSSATGLDSPGARNLRVVAGALWDAFEAAIASEGVPIANFSENVARLQRDRIIGAAEAGLTTVFEGLHRVDVKATEWKQVHMRLIWSQLGGHPGEAIEVAGCPYARELPASLRGRPITDLERIAQRPLFPKLWASFSETFRRMGGTSYAYPD